MEIANANRRKYLFKVKHFFAAVRSSKILILEFIFALNLRNNVKYTIHYLEFLQAKFNLNFNNYSRKAIVLCSNLYIHVHIKLFL